MPADLDVTVPATTRGLRAALQAIEDVCAPRAVDTGVWARARVVIEELFTNTIKYGYGGECDRPVRIKLALADELVVTFEDEAPLFDPTAWTPPASHAQLPSERPVGQAGIALVRGLSARVEYVPL